MQLPLSIRITPAVYPDRNIPAFFWVIFQVPSSNLKLNKLHVPLYSLDLSKNVKTTPPGDSFFSGPQFLHFASHHPRLHENSWCFPVHGFRAPILTLSGISLARHMRASTVTSSVRFPRPLANTPHFLPERRQLHNYCRSTTKDNQTFSSFDNDMYRKPQLVALTCGLSCTAEFQ